MIKEAISRGDRRTCFIICPIGDKDSDIRKHADNLIKRVIAPALAGLNFTFIRVDQSYANSRITDEIVTLIKKSELCIADSANYNPNVMYEIGRRHEINRPMILLRPPSQPIVFDLKDIKHVDYDLDDVDAVIETQNNIRAFLDEFEQQGFISNDASVSLDGIATSLNRLERRFDDLSRAVLSAAAPRAPAAASSVSGKTAEIISSLGPERGFIFCLNQKLVREAEEIFDMLEPQFDDAWLNSYVSILSGLGSRKAFDRITQDILPKLHRLDTNEVLNLLTGYVHSANLFGQEKDIITQLKPLIEGDLLTNADVPDEAKAILNNQLGKLYGGMEDYPKARDYYEKARKLDPSEAAFSYNAASAAFYLKEFNDAEHIIDSLIDEYAKTDQRKLDSGNYDHLNLAYKIYVEVKKNEKALNVLQMIRVGNPMLADFISSGIASL